MSTESIPLPNLALRQHFTNAPAISTIMCHLLGAVDGSAVLEPCVGHGAFLRGIQGTPALTHAVDVDASALEVVEAEFAHLRPNLFQVDFIDLFVNPLLKGTHPVFKTLYDQVIANPPFGLYLEPSYRRIIKALYPGLYARESYGLFFVFSLARLRENGKYVFLLPDTFLSSVNHRSLRAFMCSDAAPTHIIRFPSKVFETVNFGYANLCIVAGEKRSMRDGDSVQWLDLFGEGKSLSIASLADATPRTGRSLIRASDAGWSATSDEDEHMSARLTLGELAECRTGIYTGDNERFIGYDPARIFRRLNGHAIDWSAEVYMNPLTSDERERGFSGKRRYVPFIRGGHRQPFEKTAWAIDWSREAVEHYRSDKKARLQNAKFYFEEGISVPMVSSKRITAAEMSRAVFDQGVVGVFPRTEETRCALLLYLNSSPASERIKRLVNGSANNSANYLKRLPVPAFTRKACMQAQLLVTEARQTGQINQLVCDEFTSACENPTTKLDIQEGCHFSRTHKAAARGLPARRSQKSELFQYQLP